MSANETEFAIVMRGYDRGTVDDAIRDLRRELLQVSSQNAQLAAELREASQKLEASLDELKEVGSPSYSGVGARAALILSTAEDQAIRLVEGSETERVRLLESSEEEAQEIRGEAKGYYDALIAEAQRRADRTLATAKTEYEQIVSEARAEANRIVEEAVREAGATRGAIATDVAKLRAITKRETESLRATVERDLAERKLMAFREATAELDMKRANELVSEQSRIDLELELTARRSEGEADYLQKHQEAVATTQKYLDDATAQLTSALTRANAARLEAEILEAAAKSVNKSTTDSARAKAEATIAAAEAEARNIATENQRKVALEIREAEAQLRGLQAEQEAVAVYIKNLADVVKRAQAAIKKPAE